MKLNNRGWGIKEMLLLSSILVFFFGVALYFIYVFYNSIEKELLINSNNSIIEILEY